MLMCHLLAPSILSHSQRPQWVSADLSLFQVVLTHKYHCSQSAVFAFHSCCRYNENVLILSVVTFEKLLFRVWGRIVLRCWLRLVGRALDLEHYLLPASPTPQPAPQPEAQELQQADAPSPDAVAVSESSIDNNEQTAADAAHSADTEAEEESAGLDEAKSSSHNEEGASGINSTSAVASTADMLSDSMADALRPALHGMELASSSIDTGQAASVSDQQHSGAYAVQYQHQQNASPLGGQDRSQRQQLARQIGTDAAQGATSRQASALDKSQEAQAASSRSAGLNAHSQATGLNADNSPAGLSGDSNSAEQNADSNPAGPDADNSLAGQHADRAGQDATAAGLVANSQIDDSVELTGRLLALALLLMLTLMVFMTGVLTVPCLIGESILYENIGSNVCTESVKDHVDHASCLGLPVVVCDCVVISIVAWQTVSTTS